ncbi:D-TA family PLP-dependent enzyme [Candidatus Thorarchaeota archaeon]|nr:MAG: D-TA family PLP-dependent enzyme [Candidatus Thorarchaeota archaeon]
MNLEDVFTPALLVDYQRLEDNIRKMAKKAEKNSVSLRPHIKTHKCIEIGEMQLRAGAQGITVSTVEEARVFAEHGFQDITLAAPLCHDKINAILALSEDTTLRVLIDHPKTLEILEKSCRNAETEIQVLLKVDCGYHRAGVDPKSEEAIRLARSIANAKHLHFNGILTHAGHAYGTETVSQIEEIAQQEQKVMVDFASKLERYSKDLCCEVVSIGSTPTCTVSPEFIEGITEIRPGNYVFYDYTQVALGVCEINQVSLSILSSVTSVYDDHLVLDTGATALSKDLGASHLTERVSFGEVFGDYSKGTLNTDLRIASLSQEHGKVTGKPAIVSNFEPGDRMRILPNHSCLTANLGNRLSVVEDDTVKDIWKIWRGRLEPKPISD